MSKQEKIKYKGEEGFNSYYAEVFGERLERLKNSMKNETVYAELNCGGAKPYFLDTASVFAAAHLPVEGAKKILDLCAAPGGKTLVLASLMDEDAELCSNDRSFERKKRLVNV